MRRRFAVNGSIDDHRTRGSPITNEGERIMKIKSRLSIPTILVALIATLAVSFHGPVRAADDGKPHEKACTVENVAGAYGAIGSGTFLPGNAVGVPPGPFATVGRVELDGHGGFLVTSQTASFNGVIVRNIAG